MIRSAVLSALVMAGCSNSSNFDDLDNLEFREGEEVADEFDDAYLGNGDIEIYDGEDVDIPDSLIWDLDSADITRQLQPGFFATRFVVQQSDIYLASQDMTVEAPKCSVVADSHPSGKVFQLVNHEQEVVFTLWKRFVFEGDIDLPRYPKVKKSQWLKSLVVVSFKQEAVYNGLWWDDDVSVTASEEIDQANPVRRLMLAALVSGECGSFGVP